MLWLYERGLEDLRIETSFDSATYEYVLTLHRGLHNETVERFPDPETFGERVNALVRQLATERWTPAGRGPIFLRDGWKGVRREDVFCSKLTHAIT